MKTSSENLEIEGNNEKQLDIRYIKQMYISHHIASHHTLQPKAHIYQCFPPRLGNLYFRCATLGTILALLGMLQGCSNSTLEPSRLDTVDAAFTVKLDAWHCLTIFDHLSFNSEILCESKAKAQLVRLRAVSDCALESWRRAKDPGRALSGFAAHTSLPSCSPPLRPSLFEFIDIVYDVYVYVDTFLVSLTLYIIKSVLFCYFFTGVFIQAFIIFIFIVT